MTTATPTTTSTQSPRMEGPRRPRNSKPNTPKSNTPRSPLPTLTPDASSKQSISELRASLDTVITKLNEFTGTAPDAAKIAAKAFAIVKSLEMIDRKVKENDPDLQQVTAKHLEDVKDLAKKLFADFEETYGILHEDVAELKGVAVGHTVEINNVNGRVDSTNQRVDETNRHVGKLEASFRVHIVALLIGVGVSILIWIATSLIWGHFNHSPKPVKLPDGTKIPQYSVTNEFWYVVLFGFLFAIAFMFLYTLIVLILSAAANRGQSLAPLVVLNAPQTRPLAAPVFPSDAPSQGTTGSTPTPTKPHNAADAGANGVRS